MPDFATSVDSAVQEQLDRLAKLAPTGDRLGLERVNALLDRLGRPQDALPPVFHVAGTNGKGSTCAFLRSAMEAAGLKVHLFTSPHLVRFNERIRVAGTLIEDTELASLLNQVIDADGGSVGASFFEVTTVVALLAFASTRADACILEVGLGGRLDATNVIDRPAVCGIASLGLDHQQFLGAGLPDIAAEKAGIAKAGVALVTQSYPPAVAGRIGQVAREVKAPWFPRGGPWDALAVRGRLRYRDEQGELDLPLPRLPGRHQAMNAALAVAMLRHQSRVRIGESAIAAAMGWATWPARLQRLTSGPLTDLLPQGSELWLDGGHNPGAAREVARFVRQKLARRGPIHILFASLSSKDPGGMLAPFQGLGVTLHTLPIAGHDSYEPDELASLGIAMGFDATSHPSTQGALQSVAPTGDAAPIVLIFGSLYLAGQALAANNQPPD